MIKIFKKQIVVKDTASKRFIFNRYIGKIYETTPTPLDNFEIEDYIKNIPELFINDNEIKNINIDFRNKLFTSKSILVKLIDWENKNEKKIAYCTRNELNLLRKLKKKPFEIFLSLKYHDISDLNEILKELKNELKIKNIILQLSISILDANKNLYKTLNQHNIKQVKINPIYPEEKELISKLPTQLYEIELEAMKYGIKIVGNWQKPTLFLIGEKIEPSSYLSIEQQESVNKNLIAQFEKEKTECGDCIFYGFCFVKLINHTYCDISKNYFELIINDFD